MVHICPLLKHCGPINILLHLRFNLLFYIAKRRWIRMLTKLKINFKLVINYIPLKFLDLDFGDRCHIQLICFLICNFRRSNLLFLLR